MDELEQFVGIVARNNILSEAGVEWRLESGVVGKMHVSVASSEGKSGLKSG